MDGMEEVWALSCDIAPSPTPVDGMEEVWAVSCNIAPSPTPVDGMESRASDFPRSRKTRGIRGIADLKRNQ